MATLYGDTTNHWRAYANYSTANSDTATTVTVSGAGMESVEWGFQLTGNVVSTTVSLTGKDSHTGSGAFSSDSGETKQVSYLNGSWSVTRTTSAQTLTLSVTTTNSSGYMDGTSSGSTSITIPSLASYTIKYDANGGSGAPASQTKYYGQSLTLSSTKPTRQYYNFVGWATSASATSASYQPGGSYTANSSTTLYAVWTQDYVKPTVKISNCRRCNSSGTLQDDGTYARINATWSTNSGSNATSLVIEYKRSTQSTSSYQTAYSTNPNASSGTLTNYVFGGGAFNASYTYNIRLTVADSGGSTSAIFNLQPDAVLVDFNGYYKNIGFGRPAPTDYSSMIDVAENIRAFRFYEYQDDSLTIGSTPSSTISNSAYIVYDSNHTVLGGITDYQNTSGATGLGFLTSRTSGSTTNNAGMYVTLDSSGNIVFAPWNADSSYSFARNFHLLQPRQLYWTTNGTTGTVTLSESAANYNRLEILYQYDGIYATQWLTLGDYINGTTVNLMLMYPDSNDPTVCWIKTRLVQISGTSITTVRAANYQAGTAQGCQNTTAEIAIVRVLGYTVGGQSYSS